MLLCTLKRCLFRVSMRLDRMTLMLRLPIPTQRPLLTPMEPDVLDLLELLLITPCVELVLHSMLDLLVSVF